jgi:hypothetical protein
VLHSCAHKYLSALAKHQLTVACARFSKFTTLYRERELTDTLQLHINDLLPSVLNTKPYPVTIKRLGGNLEMALRAHVSNPSPLTRLPKCHLLEIPCEIRLVIYSYLLGPDAWCNSDPQEWEPEYTSTNLARLRIAVSERHGNELGAYDIIELQARLFLPGLALLRTCKQAYAEGLEVMYRGFQVEVPAAAIYYFEDWIATLSKQAVGWMDSIHSTVVVDYHEFREIGLPSPDLATLADLMPSPSQLIVTLLVSDWTDHTTRSPEDQAAVIDKFIVASKDDDGLYMLLSEGRSDEEALDSDGDIDPWMPPKEERYRRLEILRLLKTRGVKFKVRKRGRREERLGSWLRNAATLSAWFRLNFKS